MKTVKDVSEITGISIRTLRYYDEIGLLKPTQHTESGYRLYDDRALAKLQEILFLKELGISLTDIKQMLENPNYDKKQMLTMQKSVLERKRNRLNGLLELIDDVMEGVNTMNFEAFNDEEINRILDHSLELQSQESKDALVERFGSLEAFRASVADNLKDEKTAAQLIKIYGSKDKAVEASLNSTGNTEELQQTQNETDVIYRQFAQAMKTNDTNLAMDAVAKLAESYKKMFRLDNARELLLEVAKDYLNHSQLEEATDQQYGVGVTRYIGQAIQGYFGV